MCQYLYKYVRMCYLYINLRIFKRIHSHISKHKTLLPYICNHVYMIREAMHSK